MRGQDDTRAAPGCARAGDSRSRLRARRSRCPWKLRTPLAAGLERHGDLPSARQLLTPEAEVHVELRDVPATERRADSHRQESDHEARPGARSVFTRVRSFRGSWPATSTSFSARIADRGQLAFVTESPIPVLTGAPAAPSIEILVAPLR